MLNCDFCNHDDFDSGQTIQFNAMHNLVFFETPFICEYAIGHVLVIQKGTANFPLLRVVFRFGCLSVFYIFFIFSKKFHCLRVNTTGELSFLSNPFDIF